MLAPTDQNLISAFLEGMKSAFQFLGLRNLCGSEHTGGERFRVSDTDVAHCLLTPKMNLQLLSVQDIHVSLSAVPCAQREHFSLLAKL